MPDINDLIEQFKHVVEAERSNVATAEATLAAQKSKLISLERAYSALNGGSARPKKQRRSSADGVSLKTKVLEILSGSPTAMDLGALSRAIFGVDDSRHRTKISAALTPEVSNPQGDIRRVGTGIYAPRAAGE